MKKLFIYSGVFFDVVFMLILLFTLSVSAYDYFAGSAFDEEYPFFCEILYGEILKYDVLLTVVFFMLSFIQSIIDDRKEAWREY